MRERLLENLLWFLERPSVTGEEKHLCDDLEARVSRLPGWKIERFSNNLVVRRAEPDASRDRISFAGHLDTVPEPEGGLPVRVEGERVYGRGASDMKAGDAVMLALLEVFPWQSSWAEPLFVFYEREEGPFAQNGLDRVFAESPEVLDANLALVLEPTAGALEVGCVGTAQIEVTRSSAVRLSEDGRGGVPRAVRGRVGGSHASPSFSAKPSASPSQSCACSGGGNHPEAQPNHCTARCSRQWSSASRNASGSAHLPIAWGASSAW